MAVLLAQKSLSLKLQTLAVLMALFSKVTLLVNKLPTLAVLMALFSKLRITWEAEPTDSSHLR